MPCSLVTSNFMLVAKFHIQMFLHHFMEEGTFSPCDFHIAVHGSAKTRMNVWNTEKVMQIFAITMFSLSWKELSQKNNGRPAADS